MKGKGERCEISFGATGYEESVASKSNINPANLRDTAFKVTQQNLQSLFAQNPALVSDAGYLRDAIPAYMRATYLREEAQLDENVRVDLDKQVNAVADKYAEQIAGVFQGKRDPFEENGRTVMFWRSNVAPCVSSTLGRSRWCSSRYFSTHGPCDERKPLSFRIDLSKLGRLAARGRRRGHARLGSLAARDTRFERHNDLVES
jgi:hypothetical protein